MHIHYENAYQVLRNIRCEVSLTRNAQLCYNLALFGKGNISRCVQLQAPAGSYDLVCLSYMFILLPCIV